MSEASPPPAQCPHKQVTGCLLSTWSPCCACADRRAHTQNYSIYIDGSGLLPIGSRWSYYCDSCRAYWNTNDPTERSQARRASVASSRAARRGGAVTRATGGESSAAPASQPATEPEQPLPTPMGEPNPLRPSHQRRSSSVSRLRRSSELADDDWRPQYHSATHFPGLTQLRARGEMYRRPSVPVDSDRFPSAAATAQIMGLASELERLQSQVLRSRGPETHSSLSSERGTEVVRDVNNGERPAPPRSVSDGRATATVGISDDFFENWSEIDGETRRRERERSRLWSPRLDSTRRRSPSPRRASPPPFPLRTSTTQPAAEELRQRHHRRRISTSEVMPTVMPSTSDNPRRLWRLHGIENLEAELSSISAPGFRRRSEISQLSREIRDMYREAGLRETALNGLPSLPADGRGRSRPSSPLPAPFDPDTDTQRHHERESQRLRALWGDVDSEDYVSPVTALFQRSWQDHNRRQEQREILRQQQQNDDPPTNTAEPTSANAQQMNLTTPPQLPSFAELRDSVATASASENMNTNPPAMNVGEEVINARRYMAARLQLVRQERAQAARTVEPVGLDKQKDRPPPLDAEEMMLDCECKVCFQQIADTVLLPCAHLVLCEWCADQIGAKKKSQSIGLLPQIANCPVCRSLVSDRVKIFRG